MTLLDSEACDCAEFIPQLRRSHLCAECGGTRPVHPPMELIRPAGPARQRARTMRLTRQPFRLDLRSGHFGGAGCTCLACVMDRVHR